jgi:FixJ family two-component response regulator
MLKPRQPIHSCLVEISMAQPRSIVAVVEDDPSMRKSIEYLLDAYGFGVEVFVSAETFVRREPFKNISCLVLDIHLGGMSGFDLSRFLTQRGYRFPIIFITAAENEALSKEANDAGCVAVLRKPFQSSHLLDAIRQAIVRNG